MYPPHRRYSGLTAGPPTRAVSTSTRSCVSPATPARVVGVLLRSGRIARNALESNAIRCQARTAVPEAGPSTCRGSGMVRSRTSVGRPANAAGRSTPSVSAPSPWSSPAASSLRAFRQQRREEPPRQTQQPPVWPWLAAYLCIAFWARPRKQNERRRRELLREVQAIRRSWGGSFDPLPTSPDLVSDPAPAVRGIMPAEDSECEPVQVPLERLDRQTLHSANVHAAVCRSGTNPHTEDCPQSTPTRSTDPNPDGLPDLPVAEPTPEPGETGTTPEADLASSSVQTAGNPADPGPADSASSLLALVACQGLVRPTELGATPVSNCIPWARGPPDSPAAACKPHV